MGLGSAERGSGAGEVVLGLVLGLVLVPPLD
jgi:hypothetical protein